MTSMAVVLEVGARFSGQASRETPVSRVFGQGGGRVARHGNDGQFKTFDKGEQGQQLRGFSGERHGNADIPVLDDAQIPVQGVQGIQQNGGRSRGVQGSDDFGPDVAGFAYAYNDDLVAAVQSLGHEVHSLVEIVVQPGQDAAQLFNLHFKNGFGAC